MSAPTYTADQLHQGVLNAIEAKDLQAAVDILTVLVGVDPARGVALYDQIQDALTVARVLGPTPTFPPDPAQEVNG